MKTFEISAVQVDSLVILRIFETLEGLLLGVDEDSVLTITNAFKTVNPEKMLNHLDKLNYESSLVGRYSAEKDVQSQVSEQFEFQSQNPNGILYDLELRNILLLPKITT